MRACVLTQKSEEAPASSASLLATPMELCIRVHISEIPGHFGCLHGVLNLIACCMHMYVWSLHGK